MQNFFFRTEVSQSAPLPAEPSEQKEVPKGKQVFVRDLHAIIDMVLENEVSENHKEPEKIPVVPIRSQTSSLSKISNRTTVNKINLTSELLRVRRHLFSEKPILISCSILRRP